MNMIPSTFGNSHLKAKLIGKSIWDYNFCVTKYNSNYSWNLSFKGKNDKKSPIWDYNFCVTKYNSNYSWNLSFKGKNDKKSPFGNQNI